VLEPHEQVNPYRCRQLQLVDAQRRALLELEDVRHPAEIRTRIQEALEGAAQSRPAAERPLRVAEALAAGLNLGARVGREFALGLLRRAGDAWDAARSQADREAVWAGTRLLERGLSLAATWGYPEGALPLAARLADALGTGLFAPPAMSLALLESCLRNLCRLGLSGELRHALSAATGSISGGSGLATAWSRHAAGSGRLRQQLPLLLMLAGGWLLLGERDEAMRVLDRARQELGQEGREERERSALARAYAVALAQAPPAVGQRRLESLFREAGDVRDNLSTGDCFSESRLAVVEAALQPLLLPAAAATPADSYPADVAWLARGGGAAWGLAQAIYGERRYAELSVLADAMEEAGGGNPDLLARLRGPRPPTQADWVLGVLLGEG
jgi:hypothetical protein